MKRWMAAGAVCSLAFVLTACGIRDMEMWPEEKEGGYSKEESSEWDSGEQNNGENEFWKEPEAAQPQEIDLSAYDEYGEWHCGRMWVHKTDGGYDHKEGFYAYIDEKGELITEWHSDQEWIVPFDFDQDVALVYTGRDIAMINGVVKSQVSQPVSYNLIDLNGNFITAISASAYSHGVFLEDRDNWADGGFNRKYDNDPEPHAFNEYGVLFFNRVHNSLYGQHLCYALLTDGTVIQLTYYAQQQYLENYYENMNLNGFGERFVNGYLKYSDYAKASGKGYDINLFFDKEGNVAADLTDFPYVIREISDVSGEKTIDVTFVGVDDNLYCVTVDLNGQWLNEPVRV